MYPPGFAGGIQPEFDNSGKIKESIESKSSHIIKKVL